MGFWFLIVGFVKPSHPCCGLLVFDCGFCKTLSPLLWAFGYLVVGFVKPPHPCCGLLVLFLGYNFVT
jgi:hypothetical protein